MVFHMENTPPEHTLASASSRQITKWLRYGIGVGVVGILFLGIVFGPIAIYFGVRARTAATRALDGRKTKATVVIGLGVFDILIFPDQNRGDDPFDWRWRLT